MFYFAFVNYGRHLTFDFKFAIIPLGWCSLVVMRLSASIFLLCLSLDELRRISLPISHKDGTN